MAIVAAAATQSMQETKGASSVASGATSGATTPGTTFADAMKTVAAAHGAGSSPTKQAKVSKQNGDEAIFAGEAGATTSSADVDGPSVGAVGVKVDTAGSAVDGDAPVAVGVAEQSVSQKIVKGTGFAADQVKDAKIVAGGHAHVATKPGENAVALKAKHGKHEAKTAVAATAVSEEAPQDGPVGVVSVLQEPGTGARTAVEKEPDGSAVRHVSTAGQKSESVQVGAVSTQPEAKNGGLENAPATSQEAVSATAVHAEQPVVAEAVTSAAVVSSAAVKEATGVVSGNVMAGVGAPVVRSGHLGGAMAPSVHDASSARGTAAKGAEDWTVQSYEAPTSNRLEIGVSGGSWGWLKVRAELVQGGGVHAYLRGSSAGAESDLRAQASDLQSYLQGQQVSVQGVHVETSRVQEWSADANGFGGDNRSGNNGEDADGRQPKGSNYGGAKDASFELESNVFSPPAGVYGAGGWLNVLA